MKNFAIRLIAIVMAVVLFIGACYTCCLALYMCVLSSEVAEAELRAAAGTYHDRRAANSIYESVQEERDELYYGGGYKSWFSTSHKFVQVLMVLISVAIIIFELCCGYVIVEALKERRERRKRKMRYMNANRQQRQYR